MRFFNILFICLLIGQLSFAQTLFESESMAQRNEPVRIKASTTKKTPGVVTSKNERYVITNLESLILRGDLQFFYEIPNASGWSSILYVHTNPQEEFNDITGSMGVLGGGRLYFEESLLNSNIFLQGLVGFNRFSDWDLMISLEFGQRIQWK
ncbi:MAG: hypothetical protein VW397_00705, partial [Candidatus Margulisiibacteriota bacterium]